MESSPFVCALCERSWETEEERRVHYFKEHGRVADRHGRCVLCHELFLHGFFAFVEHFQKEHGEMIGRLEEVFNEKKKRSTMMTRTLIMMLALEKEPWDQNAERAVGDGEKLLIKWLRSHAQLLIDEERKMDEERARNEENEKQKEEEARKNVEKGVKTEEDDCKVIAETSEFVLVRSDGDFKLRDKNVSTDEVKHTSFFQDELRREREKEDGIIFIKEVKKRPGEQVEVKNVKKVRSDLSDAAEGADKENQAEPSKQTPSRPQRQMDLRSYLKLPNRNDNDQEQQKIPADPVVIHNNNNTIAEDDEAMEEFLELARKVETVDQCDIQILQYQSPQDRKEIFREQSAPVVLLPDQPMTPDNSTVAQKDSSAQHEQKKKEEDRSRKFSIEALLRDVAKNGMTQLETAVMQDETTEHGSDQDARSDLTSVTIESYDSSHSTEEEHPEENQTIESPSLLADRIMAQVGIQTDDSQVQLTSGDQEATPADVEEHENEVPASPPVEPVGSESETRTPDVGEIGHPGEQLITGEPEAPPADVYEFHTDTPSPPLVEPVRREREARTPELGEHGHVARASPPVEPAAREREAGSPGVGQAEFAGAMRNLLEQANIQNNPLFVLTCATIAALKEAHPDADFPTLMRLGAEALQRVPTEVPPIPDGFDDTFPFQRCDQYYLSGVGTPSCPRCRATKHSSQMRAHHYKSYHYHAYYSEVRYNKSEMKRWLRKNLGEDQMKPRVCMHCDRRRARRMRFHGRKELLQHIQEAHPHDLDELKVEYAELSRYEQPQDPEVHEILKRRDEQ